MKETICFIGIGNMGSSLVDSFISKNIWQKDKIILCDCESSKLSKYKSIKELLLFEDASEAVQHSENIIIAVKPQNCFELFYKIRDRLSSNALLISIMAGVSILTIQQLTRCAAIIRAMPNLPITLGKGLIGWACSKQVNEKKKLIFKRICYSFGKAIYFNDESHLDIITALSGSGPMYVALFANSLIKAGESLGLSSEQSKIATIQTIIGSALMLQQLPITPEQLMQKITSKGGTTEQASCIFQKYDFENIIAKAVHAAYTRAQTLCKTYQKCLKKKANK